MRIDSSGNVLVGSDTGARLTVTGNDGGSGFRVTGSNNHWNSMYPDASGNIYFQSDTSYCTLAVSGTSWSCPSDARLKQNVELLQADSGLAAVMQLRPISFDLISDATHAPQIGFMAQDVQQIFPQLVWRSSATSTLTPDGTLVLSQTGLIAPMVKAIQELNLKLEDLASTSSPQAQDEDHFTSRFFASLYARLTQWFADTTKGIQDFYARVFKGEKLCLGETCITEPELQELLDS
jgi:hypothetical protein